MSDGLDHIWPRVLQHIRTHQPLVRRHWFDQLTLAGIENGVLEVRAQSAIHRDYLQRECQLAFSDAARAVTGRLVSVRFLGPGGTRRPDALVINPDYGFENFVIGPNNRLAHAAALAVADKPAKTYNPLFIHGGVGLGKTHLLQAAALRLVGGMPDADLYYTSCESFSSRFMDSVQAGAMGDFRHTFRDVDVLIVDDIHYLSKRDRTQEEFFHTFNSLYQAGKQIILSSDAAPEEIPHLEERLVSRFKSGLVTQIQPPGYETRVAILKKKANLRGLELPEEVAMYIATRIDTNIRELEGAIVKLQMHATIEGRPIDIALAKIAVGDPPAPTSNEPTIQIVIGAVTEFFGIRLTDLQSKRRHRSISQPRQVCMYLAREHTNHSLVEIGGYFGGRDHTTVMHALRAVEERRKSDPEFNAIIVSLSERLRAPRKPAA